MHSSANHHAIHSLCVLSSMMIDKGYMGICALGELFVLYKKKIELTMQRTINLTMTEAQEGQRIDQAVAALLPSLSRSRIQQWIKQGALTLNDSAVTPKQKVYLGDVVAGNIEEQQESDFIAQDLPIDIVYQDNSVIVINKPAGLVVHPGAGNPDGTLLNALLYHFPESASVPRAGIVHRLDKETSGVMVVAKTLEAQFHLVQQLQARTVKRLYVALVVGEMTGGGKVEVRIGRSGNDRLRMSVTPGGKEAITHYQIAERFAGLTLLTCRLETGRTHQIRVHMAHIRHPLVGDPLYGGRNRIPKGLDAETREHILNFPRQALHARELAFLHPDDEREMRFEVELPQDMQALLAGLLPQVSEAESDAFWHDADDDWDNDWNEDLDAQP